MKKTNIATLVSTFYQKHKERLRVAYPGIKPSKIECLLLEWERKYHCHLSPEQNSIRVNDYFFHSLLKGVPLEYILQEKYFYKNLFYINEFVLIPRSETELLVEQAVGEIKALNKETVDVLDVGTGSGCIGLSVAIDTNIKGSLHLIDIDLSALKVAKKNVFLKSLALHPDLQVSCYQSDLLANVKDKKFDLIVSNPPYIKRRKDYNKVHWQVAKYEPKLALFLDDSEYDSWFSHFFTELQLHLKEAGVFIMEGHEDHLKDLVQLAKSLGLGRVELLKDYTGRHRFLKARRS